MASQITVVMREMFLYDDFFMTSDGRTNGIFPAYINELFFLILVINIMVTDAWRMNISSQGVATGRHNVNIQVCVLYIMVFMLF